MPDLDIQCPTQAYIGGRWCDARDGRTFDVTNPATGEVIATVADCGADETRTAIAAADAAQKAWAGWTASDRANVLKRWRDLMVAQADRLARILMLENGKPLAEARGEILYGASYLEWFAEESRRIYGDVIPAPAADKRIVVIRQPVGVCAAITPWNFPNAMLARKAAAALAAGCTMVAKPAEDTPLSALVMAELAGEAGIPKAYSMSCQPPARRMSAANSRPVQPFARSVSQGRPKSADCCSDKLRERSRRSRWSLAAMRLSSCLTMPTSTQRPMA